MPRICTITFSPCIDKSIGVASLIPEKKLRCTTPVLQPGGGGINVARAIHQLGGEALAIYPAGGCTGDLLTTLMRQEGISSRVVRTETETRENIIVLEESTNRQYKLCMPSLPLEEMTWKAILDKVEHQADLSYLVISGSMPTGMPIYLFNRLATIAEKKKVKMIVDTSGPALKEAALRGTYLLKPNLAELASLVNKEQLLPGEIIPAAKQVIAMGCGALVVSMGAAGAMLITKDIVRTTIPPSIKVKSTVGAGDSLVAGIVFSLSRGTCLEDAVDYGIACGSAATMNPGTSLCNRQDADRLYSLIHSGKKTVEKSL